MCNKFLFFCCIFLLIVFQVSDIDSMELYDNDPKDFKISKKPVSNVNREPFGNIYRSDGFTNKIASEWFQVGFEENTNKIFSVWYWNSNFKSKELIEIKNQKLNEGEVSRISGEIIFQNEIVPFQIIEDRFMIVNENKVQDFDYERVEEHEL